MSEEVRDGTFKKPLFSVEWTTLVPENGSDVISPTFYLNSILCEFILSGKDGIFLNIRRKDELTFNEFFNCSVVVKQSRLKIPHVFISECADLQTQYLYQIYLSERKLTLIKGEEISFLVTIDTDRSRPEKDDYSSNCSHNGLRSLSQDFEKLLDDQNADIKVLCGSSTFLAHSTIISTRSKVFEKMLKTDMMEKRTGSIEIVDIKPDVIKELLRYMYTGTLTEMTVQKALLLYEVGDKYQVSSLVKDCVIYLHSSLCGENVYEILTLADKQNDSGLKEHALLFIAMNNIDLNDEHWNTFEIQQPVLAFETIKYSYSLVVTPSFK